MQKKLSFNNIIVFIGGVIFCVLSTILLKKVNPSFAAKLLILNVFAYLAAFILPKIVLFVYLLVISIFMVVFKVYGDYSFIYYIPYIVEMVTGAYIISILDKIFFNNELISTIFGTIFGRLIFFVAGYFVYDLFFEIMSFSIFFNKYFFEQIYGMFISIILVPLISYAIKSNTIITSGEA